MRPYVICHMLQSINEKVTGDFLSKEEANEGIEIYYKINRELKKDAIALGRVTMEDSFTNKYYPSLEKYKGNKIKKEDYIDSLHDFYMIAFDRYGRLGYKDNKIIDPDEGYNNAYIIEVLLEDTKEEYLAYLQELHISYIFAGKEELNISLALEKLNKYFNIKNIILEGGSIINGAFIKEDLVDEVSLVTVPVLAKDSDKPLSYGYEFNKLNFKLKEETINEGIVIQRFIKE